jgi:hypothetical protein
MPVRSLLAPGLRTDRPGMITLADCTSPAPVPFGPPVDRLAGRLPSGGSVRFPSGAVPITAAVTGPLTPVCPTAGCRGGLASGGGPVMAVGTITEGPAETASGPVTAGGKSRGNKAVRSDLGRCGAGAIKARGLGRGPVCTDAIGIEFPIAVSLICWS